MALLVTARVSAVNVVPSNVSAAASTNLPPVPANVTRPAVKLVAFTSSACTVALAVTLATPVILPPLIAMSPADPPNVNVEPLNVKFALSTNAPSVPANVTRPLVRSLDLTVVALTTPVVTLVALSTPPEYVRLESNTVESTPLWKAI